MTRRRVGDLVAASAGLVVLVAGGFVVRDGTVGSVELGVFHAINGLPDALTPMMNAAQLLGVLVVGPVVAFAALILRRWRLAMAALLVTGGKLLAERTVWEVVQRSRPGTTISDAVVRGGAPASGVSFVSGHVVLVTGLAWVITPHSEGGGASFRGCSSRSCRSRASTSARTRRSTSSVESASAWSSAA